MFTSFVMLLVGGMLGTFALSPIAKIAWGFSRLLGILVLLGGTYVLVDAIQQSYVAPLALTATAIVALAGIALIVAAPYSELNAPAANKIMLIASIAGAVCSIAAGLAWLSYHKLSVGESAAQWFIVSLGHVLSGGLAGCVTINWLLGHRYLTATDMVIDPFRSMSAVLLWILGGRWVLLLAVTGYVVTTGTTPQLMGDWFMIAVRIGVGLVVPAVFCYMAWDCVRLRSTQSATGILFFASILIVIGELTSQFLVPRIGLPL